MAKNLKTKILKLCKDRLSIYDKQELYILLLRLPYDDITFVKLFLDNYYKVKIFLTSNVEDEHTYFLYEHYDKKDPKLSIYANNEPVVNITYKQKKQTIKALYLSLIDMYKYPISKDALEKSTIKRTLSKPRLLNLTKMNGSILFRFMPIFTEEEIREMERDQKSEKGFDKI